MCEAILIFLIIYSLIATITIIVLSCCIYKSKRNRKHKNCSEATATDTREDFDKVHRTGTHNGNISSPQQELKLTRLRTLSSHRSHIVSEYDLIACRPKLHSPGKEQTLSPRYGEADSFFEGNSRQCGAILQQVVDSLSDAFVNASREEDLKEKFLLALSLKLKQKDPKLYEDNQRVTSSKHHYEEIKSKNENKRVDDDADDEKTYQKYYAKRTGILTKKDLINDEAQSHSGLGFDDCLEFPVEKNSSENRSDIKAPYLKPKLFKTKSDFPEQLQQYPNSNSVRRNQARTQATASSEDKLAEIVAEYYSLLAQARANKTNVRES